MEEITTSSQIRTLIKFLLKNGSSVIGGHTKFSVTPQILKEINTILDKLKEDIFVSSLTNADLINKYATKNDLMFLYDFVKKTPKLKISNTASSHNFSVDIADFSSLKYLELYKFNVKHIKNLNFLSDHLEMVVCVRSVENVVDLFENPNDDNIMWSKLKHVVLSRNFITSIDHAFVHTPWIQYLDISYNHLTDIRPLTCLRYLTYLNASYNNLKEIPNLSLFELKTILLSNNHISDISGISLLKNIQECDLSGNCIDEHVNLLPFAELPSLMTLNVTQNPICYHPKHRSLTCGYLHENVSNLYFMLDGRPLNPAEKQFIRHCSRIVVNKLIDCSRTISTSSIPNEVSDQSLVEVDTKIGKTKKSKKVREAVIVDKSFESDEKEEFASSTPIKNKEESVYEHFEIKKQIDFLRSTYGEEGWLHGNSASVVQNLFNIESSAAKTPPSSSISVPISETINSKSPVKFTKIILENSLKEKESYFEEIVSDEMEKTLVESNDITLGATSYESSSSRSSSSEESDSEENYSIDDLWPVEKICEDRDERIFLTLTDSELKEKNLKTNKVITKWGIDQIQRYVKISSVPFELSLHFDVQRRNDRTRKYRMEYADAQKLIARIEKELEKKTLDQFNQKLLQCMKCSTYFCVEMRLRRSGFIEHESKYKCSACGSDAVIEEDESSIQTKTNSELSFSPSKTTKPPTNYQKVTQSPSLSSIGSAASLDQSTDAAHNNDSNIGYQESDIEVISNPSQSSIEVLEIHGSDNTKKVLKIVDKPAALTATNNSNNYVLTESSSSGSMTDSICTSYDTSNQIHSRGPARISQSTVDEVLYEEPIIGSLPKKLIIDTDPKTTDKKLRLDFSSVLCDVLQTVSSKLISSSPQKSSLTSAEFDGPLSKYEYSYTDFTYVDHRIKLYIWDQIIPTNEDILAFIKADSISKSNASNQLFPGYVVLTDKKLYIMKINKEEKGDPNLWLQKYDNVLIEKVKVMKPIYWKQGFSIEIEDRPSSSNTTKYLILLYNEKRTEDFLSFIEVLNTVCVQKLDEPSDERNLSVLLEIDEQVRNFTMSEVVTITKDDAEYKKFPFVGFITTNRGFSIIKAEVEWLLSNVSMKPDVLFGENMSNLVAGAVTKNSLMLQFLDEKNAVEFWWNIKTVCEDSNRRILSAIREPWEEIFLTELPLTQSAN